MFTVATRELRPGLAGRDHGAALWHVLHVPGLYRRRRPKGKRSQALSFTSAILVAWDDRVAILVQQRYSVALLKGAHQPFPWALIALLKSELKSECPLDGLAPAAGHEQHEQ